MWRLILLLAGLLTGVQSAETSDVKKLTDDTSTAKRSPVSAYGQGQYVDAQEIPQEYLALLHRYLEAQQQQQQHQQPQPQHQVQATQHVPRAQQHHGGLVEQELVRLVERPVQQKLQHHQAIPLDLEQYHVETSPRRAQPQQQQLYYPVQEEVQVQAHQPQAQPQVAEEPQQQQQLRYHQAVPIQYGYEDEQQVQREQHNPQAIVRAQSQAEAAALAFQKIAQAAHYKHQESALEQIRLANEKHRQQSALEQIRQGESVSEAGLKERLPPKDPESAYKAQLKAQATALVAEHRRAKEAAEYKAHAEAILKLQAQQRAHLRAQEQAHHFALNYEKNQQRAQAHAQAIANAQALALYRARQEALAKAQNEAKQAAKAQADARKIDPDNVPVVQYLLPNKVALPAPEVYLPKAAEALRQQEAAAAQEKRLKKPQHQIKHLVLEEYDPSYLRRPSGKAQEEQQLTFLVDAGYYRKQQQQQQQQQIPRSQYVQEDVEQGRYPAQYHQHIDPERLALLVPAEP